MSKQNECYYVERGVPFDELLGIKRMVNGVVKFNACTNDKPTANQGGWIPYEIVDTDVRIPTWQAKAYWPYITKV